MKFDASLHKCVIIVDSALGPGHAINAASVIGVSLGTTVTGLVGPDMSSQDQVNYPGVIYAPLPILLASDEAIRGIHSQLMTDEEVHSIPFSALAQSCKTYVEYESRINQAHSSGIELVALGLIGPKKTINRLTGSLPLFR